MMVGKDFIIGDLVCAKMEGYPAWPAKIVERTELPFTKKHHHYVCFFGSKNHAWILDENITPHSQSMIADYENKETLPALRDAIKEITEYIQSLPPTLASGEEVPTSISDEEVGNSDEVDNSKCSKESSEDDSLKPGTSKSIAKDLGMKHKKDKESQERKQSRSKASDAPKRKADVLSGNDASGNDANAQPSTPLPTDKNIGILGLGTMGLTIVKRLLKSGHKVTVWDRNVGEYITKIKGAHEGLSPMDVAKQCDIIISCVVDSEGTNHTLNSEYGVLQGLEGCNGTKGYVEMTCVGEQKSKDIAEVVTKTGATYLEAPLIGPVNLPESEELAIFASGDKKLFDCCSTVFYAISSKVYYVSDIVGQASTYSEACKAFSNATRAALTEGMALASRMNISVPGVLVTLSLAGFNSPLILEQGMDILRNNFDASYSPCQSTEEHACGSPNG